MGLLRKSRDQPRARVQRAPTPTLLEFSENSLNTIGRALEAYRLGDPAGLLLACSEAALLREMLDEVHSRA